MSFLLKADENKSVVAKCLTMNAYNAGANRAYYCVYQRARQYLLDKKFDYDQFLDDIANVTDRPYSHGTIQRALVECLRANGKKIQEYLCLNVWDMLYVTRIRADYSDKVIGKVDLEISKKNMEIILAVFDEKKGKDV